MSDSVIRNQSDPAAALACRRVLVTGASGFLGQHLCRALLGAGTRLHAAVRDLDRLADRHRYHGVWKVDVRDLAQIRSVVDDVGPEVIFHLAGFSSARPSPDLVLPMIEHNLLGTVHTLLAAAEAGCKRVVLVSSAEELRGPDLSGALTSPYGAAKMAATLYGRLFDRVYGLPVVFTRPLMAYGPRQDAAKLIPYVITSLLRNEAPRLSSGSRSCDFVYVDDVIRGLLLAAVGPNLGGRMLELGTGRATHVRDVVTRIGALMGATVAPAYGALADRPEEPMTPADVETTCELTGWVPRWTLDEGLLATIAYYRDLMRVPAPAPIDSDNEDETRENEFTALAGQRTT
jgi:nucleoside-diphosphate-sugar epimerase